MVTVEVCGFSMFLDVSRARHPFAKMLGFIVMTCFKKCPG